MDASSPPERRDWRETLRMRGRLLQRLPLTMILTCLLLLLGSIQLTYQIGNNLYRTYTWNAETEEVRGRVAELQRQLRNLKAAESAANDPEYMRNVARCQGFVGAGETLVVSPDAPTTPSETCDIKPLP